jgi:hypothetical protein
VWAVGFKEISLMYLVITLTMRLTTQYVLCGVHVTCLCANNIAYIHCGSSHFRVIYVLWFLQMVIACYGLELEDDIGGSTRLCYSIKSHPKERTMAWFGWAIQNFISHLLIVLSKFLIDIVILCSTLIACMGLHYNMFLIPITYTIMLFTNKP